MDKTVHYQSESTGYGKDLILIFCALFLTLVSGQANSQIKIVFTGDILLSRNVEAEIQTRQTFPWEKLTALFQQADLVAGNLEGAVGKNREVLQEKTQSPVFAVDPSEIQLLSRAGFNIITVENNHSLDLGKNGKKNTIDVLRNHHLTPVYSDNSPQFFTIKDTVIALITLNTVLCRDSSKNQLPSVEIRQKLHLAKSLAKIVVVSIHWGSELLDWPSMEQREIAGWLIKNGADIIIGSHPHVIQKPELIDGKPVFFSLGNHLFDQKYPETKEGLIVELTLNHGMVYCDGFITHTRPNSFYPEIIKKADFGFNQIPLTNRDFRIGDYTLRPLSVADTTGNKIILQAFQNNLLIWETRPKPVVTIESGDLDGKNEYLFLLEKHYSPIDGETNLRPYVYQVDDQGLIDRWRGSALAWPVLDARLSPVDHQTLYVLHRGDSYIRIDKTEKTTRVAAYRWNHFGFTGIADSTNLEFSRKLFEE